MALSRASGGTDSLSQPAAPPAAEPVVPATELVPLDRLQASVDVAVIAAGGATPTLAARAADQAWPLGAGRVDVPVELTAVAGRQVSFLPLVELAASASSDGGTALLGLSGMCGRPGSCAAAFVPSTVVPGAPATAVVRLQPRSGDRQTTPGIYRLDVPLADDQLLRIVVGVTERTASAPPAPTAAPPSPAPGTTVRVFSGDTAACENVHAVDRSIPATEAVATAALDTLLAGPTDQEQADGLCGFGPETAELLRSVRIADGAACVDLDASRLPGNYSTSCGGTAFRSMVERTLTQFPTVDRVVVALDGDPRAYRESMQLGCQEPVEPGGAGDPAPFRSGR